MYLMRYGIIEPILKYGYQESLGINIDFELPAFYFFILVMINVFLGAGGYAINDYFDRKIDAINRPDEMVVDKQINRRTVIILHIIFDAIAILLAAWFSLFLGKPTILVMYIMIAGIFWLYSTTYKKQLIIGNVIVALGTATIPLQVGYFDVLLLNRAYAAEMVMKGISFSPILYWMAAFALFAFLTNLVREIIKDMQDLEGDESYGCNTIPIVYGMKTAKIIVVALVIAIISVLAIFYYRYLTEQISFWYLVLMVALPLCIAAVLTIKANTVRRFKRISLIIKLVMLSGVLYALVARQLMVFLFNFQS